MAELEMTGLPNVCVQNWQFSHKEMIFLFQYSEVLI